MTTRMTEHLTDVRPPPTSRRRWWIVGTAVAVAVALVAVLVAVAPWAGDDSAPTDGAAPGSAPDADVSGPSDATPPEVDPAALVAAVPAEPVAKIDPVRLAPGVVPPSNRWYSGLVFGDQPQPVFAEPLSFGLTGSGFTLGLPDPTVDAKVVIAPHVPAVTVDAGATSAQISAADPVSVTIDLLDGAGEVLGRVVLAAGSPFVSLTAQKDLTLSSAVSGGSFEAGDGGAATADAGTSQWGLVGGTTDGGSTTLSAGQSASWYALPPDASAAAEATLRSAAADPVTGVEVSYGVDETVARTTLTYLTAGGTPTAYVLMPHHNAGDQPRRDCGLGAYPSVYGDLELCAGSSLTSFAPALPAAAELDLDGISKDERTAIVDALAADVAATPAFPSDTYFGGKALNRAASLVVLGEQLGVPDVVADLRSTTVDALREWAQPDGCAERDARCVVYDETARSVIGLTPSFGSEELNDHHFHYGYFLAAAGLLAQDDASLADELAPVMNLLAQDIAAALPSDELPQLRAFDPYAGHSWASGTSPFADGNNQESSSEAVTAWNGLGLWARASAQPELETQATWLASTEALTARTYWTAPDLEQFEGFEHTMMSLNWGGKRDYATWFSPEPNAILGIQLIPMGPVQTAMATGVDPERIRASVEEATPGGYGVQFGGYLLMYRALAGPDDAAAAWTEATSLPDVAVDDGSSRSAMLAFIASAKARPVG
ncbi:1,3-beta-glucanase [Cellulomonas sp. zg-ZUI188]|uniref:glucan endo-1,3-beta-D-glucosidase n=2 Tax=Cellulomonas fengjieae TaxID=2819978 RepID=A0ABS3SET2_9CELL|nr:1,3-beta-glucanase [Cellulomonas fengjieae]QVI64500.1 1,3-beta-glucanase [Cellulomonas fengjieae]